MKNPAKLFSYDKSFSRGQLETPSGEILQVAELSVIRGGEIREHVQPCDEITLAISGKAKILSGEKTLEMQAGQIHFIRAGQKHRIEASSEDNFHYCCIGFLPRKEERSVAVFYEACEGQADFLVEDPGGIRALFSLLINEFDIRDDQSRDMIHFYFCQMLILLYRGLSGKRAEHLSRTASSGSQAVYRALKYMDREYMHLTRVKEIAAALSYSEYHLCHIFKEKMNLTLKEYLMRKKLMTAVELLKTSSMTVSEISDQLHFSSPHAFSLAFKRYFDCSPSSYRNSVAGEDLK